MLITPKPPESERWLISENLSDLGELLAPARRICPNVKSAVVAKRLPYFDQLIPKTEYAEDIVGPPRAASFDDLSSRDRCDDVARASTRDQ